MKTNKLMSILTVVSLLLIIWEITIYRKTFISVYVPLSILVFGGLIAFFLFRNKINYYRKNKKGIFLQSMHGIILFGGFLVFSFMGANYYFSSHKQKLCVLEVIEKGYMAEGTRSCGNPYVIVIYNNTQKRLVFPCDTKIEHYSSVELALYEGLFGFVVAKDINPIISKP